MKLRKEAVSTLRVLGTDMINKSNSGHPGIVLGAAPILEALYCDFMNVNVNDTNWINRDRFVLSAGHGAPLLYSLLHLAGFGLSIDDLKELRQYGSLTPGHPECDVTKGIDASTGPLGQGIAMAVGMAITETFMANKFNKDDLDIINHYTYALIGDGDLQEGVCQEAMSLAGHLGLNKLIVLYDSNEIQLDGSTKMTISENVKDKYIAMGWNYLEVVDGNNSNEIVEAMTNAKMCPDKPTIIEVRTIIGYGTKVAGNSASHGAPIGAENSDMLRSALGYKNEPFTIDDDVYSYFNENVVLRGEKVYQTWQSKYAQYAIKYPELLEELTNGCKCSYVSNTELSFELGHKEATRNIGGKILDALSKEFPTLIGGSADLTKSTKAKGADGNYSKFNVGRNINFGVREHAMGAIVNGMMLHGGVRSFSGAFFVFSDYMKPAMRCAALMHLPSLYVFTHDSIAVGEDGPTHEPIEQLVSLRATPNLNVIRPCDANETVSAFKLALASNKTPTTIILTRQDVVTVSEKTCPVELGAYIIKKETNKLDGILLACGSEVQLAIAASVELEKQGLGIRVVSIPSVHNFEQQSYEYQQSILPSQVKTMAIEMGSSIGWYKYADIVLGIDTFGASGKAEVLIQKYGFTVENVVNKFLNK